MNFQEEMTDEPGIQGNKGLRCKIISTSRKQEGIQQDCQTDSDWKSQSKQFSFPSGCEKQVTGHCGGVRSL
jgi:hypothetical protein